MSSDEDEHSVEEEPTTYSRLEEGHVHLPPIGSKPTSHPDSLGNYVAAATLDLMTEELPWAIKEWMTWLMGRAEHVYQMRKLEGLILPDMRGRTKKRISRWRTTTTRTRRTAAAP